MADLFKSLIGYTFSDDANKMAEQKPLKYIAAGNGMFERRENRLMKVNRKLAGVPKLPSLEEGVELNTPKVPFSVFNAMAAFLKKIYEKDATEATIMLFYNEERNEWILWVPLQENGGASSDYKRDEDEDYTRMCKENILVMVTHSHPWGSGGISVTGPNPSAVDDKDEKEALLYMIVGNVKGVPTTYVSTCPGGTRMKLKFFDVFTNPLLPEGTIAAAASLVAKYVPDHEIFPMFYSIEGIEVPDAWLARCKKKTYTYTQYAHPTQYGYGKDDPKSQYFQRTRGYDEWDDAEGDYSNYANYYYGSGQRPYSTFEDQTEEEIEKEYERKLLGKDDEEEDVEVVAQVTEEMEYDIEDMMDACSFMTDVDIARLVFSLIQDGRAGLIHQCMIAIENREKRQVSSSQKASTAPGLTLVKHESDEGGSN